MKEYFYKKIRNEEVDEYIKTMEIFDWKVTDKTIEAYKTSLSFERDNETPYYKEMVLKEKAWNKKYNPTMIHIYILSILSIIVITGALITHFLFPNAAFHNPLVYSLLFSGIGVFMIASLFFFLRIKKGQKNIMSFYEDRHQLKEEIKALKDGKDLS